MHTVTLELSTEQMDRLTRAAREAEKTPEEFIHDAALRRAREVLSFGCSGYYPTPGAPVAGDPDRSGTEDAVYDNLPETG